MKQLKKEYEVLKRKINNCWSVIDIIHEMKENLIAKGRGYTEVTNDEARNYLYCLEENLTIDLYSVEKRIVQRILKLVENDRSLCTEFIPYKYPKNSTNLIYHIKYMLCEYDGYYYLIDKMGDLDSLIFIFNDLISAIEAFCQECKGFIEIRKDIDARYELTPEQRAKIEKVEYNDIPSYDEILKYFNKINASEQYVNKSDGSSENKN
jgi:phage pi2 protein 07